MITKPLALLFVFLVLSAKAFENDFQSQGIDPQDIEYPEQQEQLMEEEEQDMVQFAEHMADFLPTETFTFDLDSDVEEHFMIWEEKGQAQIRGVFHAEGSNGDGEDNVNLKVLNNGRLVREYHYQRLGVYKVHVQKGDRVSFYFSANYPIAVYFSYENRPKSQIQKPQSTSNITETQQIIEKFTKIKKILVEQQSQMLHLMQISEKHQKRIRKNLDASTGRLIVETLMIVGSGLLGLWILKRQIYEGYTMLV